MIKPGSAYQLRKSGQGYPTKISPGLPGPITEPGDRLDRLAAPGGAPGSGASAYRADAGTASSAPMVWAEARIWPYIRRWSSLSRSSSCGCCASPACSR